METVTLLEMIETLPEDKQAEVFDFVRFLKYRAARERLCSSDKEERIAFESVDDLMDAIENAG